MSNNYTFKKSVTKAKKEKKNNKKGCEEGR